MRDPQLRSDRAGSSRRHFLRNSLGALAMAPLAGVVSGQAAEKTASQSSGGGSKTILILGAGMSGLTAALSLLRRGHNVTVIEYQDRVGGRLLSVAG